LEDVILKQKDEYGYTLTEHHVLAERLRTSSMRTSIVIEGGQQEVGY